MQQYGSTASQALAQLSTDALRDEAQALAWHLFQEHGMDLGVATVEAVSTIGDVLAFAEAWDAETTQPKPAPAELDTAARKAAWYASQGVVPIPTAAATWCPAAHVLASCTT
jgi:hypothetical protein